MSSPVQAAVLGEAADLVVSGEAFVTIPEHHWLSLGFWAVLLGVFPGAAKLCDSR